MLPLLLEHPARLEPAGGKHADLSAIGGHLVLGELLKRGAEVYVAHSDRREALELVLVGASRARRIQVRTLDWPGQKAVNCGHLAGSDILVVVLLDKEHPRSRFFVFPVPDLGLMTAHNPDHLAGHRVILMSRKSVDLHLARYEDDWGSLVPGGT